ncbi:hypothetical protein ACOMHN_006556 [Nucella lapillus]
MWGSPPVYSTAGCEEAVSDGATAGHRNRVGPAGFGDEAGRLLVPVSMPSVSRAMPSGAQGARGATHALGH